MEDAKRLADAVEKVQCFFSNLDFSPSPTSLSPPPTAPPPPLSSHFLPKKKERKSYVKSCHEKCLVAD